MTAESRVFARLAQMVEHGIRQSDSAKNMLDTRQKGNLTELQCLAAFVE